VIRDTELQGQPGLQSEFQDSQGYTEKPCLKKPKKKKRYTELGRWAVVAHTFNPRTQEAEAVKSLGSTDDF
jgi:hypothetical protein